jgi:glutaminyl-tRNA synthetase
MRLGHYKKGEATLRMKMNLESGNPQMWDLVAYRIVEAEHHRTGAEWKIYPYVRFLDPAGLLAIVLAS